MAPRLSDDLKECIVQWYYKRPEDNGEIRDLSRCSIGFVYNVIRNYRDFGQVRNPFSRRIGRPRTGTPTDEDLSFR